MQAIVQITFQLLLPIWVFHFKIVLHILRLQHVSSFLLFKHSPQTILSLLQICGRSVRGWGSAASELGRWPYGCNMRSTVQIDWPYHVNGYLKMFFGKYICSHLCPISPTWGQNLTANNTNNIHKRAENILKWPSHMHVYFTSWPDSSNYSRGHTSIVLFRQETLNQKQVLYLCYEMSGGLVSPLWTKSGTGGVRAMCWKYSAE